MPSRLAVQTGADLVRLAAHLDDLSTGAVEEGANCKSGIVSGAAVERLRGHSAAAVPSCRAREQNVLREDATDRRGWETRDTRTANDKVEWEIFRPPKCSQRCGGGNLLGWL